MTAMQVLVLAPTNDGSSVHRFLAPGTAIVTPLEGGGDHGILRAWYEEPGNAANVVTFEDRLTHAAGRYAQQYPTGKMTGFEQDDVTIVAIAEHEEGNGWYVSKVIDRDRLEAWAGEAIVEGGSADFIRRRIARGFNPSGRR